MGRPRMSRWIRDEPREEAVHIAQRRLALTGVLFRRFPLRQRRDQRLKFGNSVPGLDPSGDVALRRTLRPRCSKIEHAHPACRAMQRGCHLGDVVASGLIVVADYDYVGTAQSLSIFRAPLVRAAGIGGRGEPTFAKGVRVFSPSTM